MADSKGSAFGGVRGQGPWPFFLACLLLTACNHPLDRPIDLFHNLEGGQIAAARPPPPGVGQPFPKLGTVPAKPTVPDPAYRRALQSQLTAERDTTERLAADTPIEAVPPPPPPAAPAPAAQPQIANAVLDTADAPPPAATSPPPPPLAKPSEATGGAAAASPPPADIGPAAGAPLSIAGVPGDFPGLPDIPASPPLPATFEGVSAEPSPTPRPMPVHLPAPDQGAQVFFADGSSVLPPSQTQALKDFLVKRGHHSIEIIGQGDAANDSPDGQATAIALGLARARAVATALEALHVPQGAMQIGANAFGRGAVLRLLP